jgi:hypothetical protein
LSNPGSRNAEIEAEVGASPEGEHETGLEEDLGMAEEADPGRGLIGLKTEVDMTDLRIDTAMIGPRIEDIVRTGLKKEEEDEVTGDRTLTTNQYLLRIRETQHLYQVGLIMILRKGMKCCL